MSNIFFDNHQPASFKSTEVTPKALQPIFTLIPDELKALPRWVTSLKKVPYCSGRCYVCSWINLATLSCDFGINFSEYFTRTSEGFDSSWDATINSRLKENLFDLISRDAISQGGTNVQSQLLRLTQSY